MNCTWLCNECGFGLGPASGTQESGPTCPHCNATQSMWPASAAADRTSFMAGDEGNVPDGIAALGTYKYCPVCDIYHAYDIEFCGRCSRGLDYWTGEAARQLAFARHGQWTRLAKLQLKICTGGSAQAANCGASVVVCRLEPSWATACSVCEELGHLETDNDVVYLHDPDNQLFLAELGAIPIRSCSRCRDYIATVHNGVQLAANAVPCDNCVYAVNSPATDNSAVQEETLLDFVVRLRERARCVGVSETTLEAEAARAAEIRDRLFLSDWTAVQNIRRNATHNLSYYDLLGLEEVYIARLDGVSFATLPGLVEYAVPGANHRLIQWSRHNVWKVATGFRQETDSTRRTAYEIAPEVATELYAGYVRYCPWCDEHKIHAADHGITCVNCHSMPTLWHYIALRDYLDYWENDGGSINHLGVHSCPTHGQVVEQRNINNRCGICDSRYTAAAASVADTFATARRYFCPDCDAFTMSYSNAACRGCAVCGAKMKRTLNLGHSAWVPGTLPLPERADVQSQEDTLMGDLERVVSGESDVPPLGRPVAVSDSLRGGEATIAPDYDDAPEVVPSIEEELAERYREQRGIDLTEYTRTPDLNDIRPTRVIKVAAFVYDLFEACASGDWDEEVLYGRVRFISGRLRVIIYPSVYIQDAVDDGIPIQNRFSVDIANIYRQAATHNFLVRQCTYDYRADLHNYLHVQMMTTQGVPVELLLHFARFILPTTSDLQPIRAPGIFLDDALDPLMDLAVALPSTTAVQRPALQQDNRDERDIQL